MNRPKLDDYTKNIIFAAERGDGSIEYVKDLDYEKYVKDLEKYCDRLEKAFGITCSALETGYGFDDVIEPFSRDDDRPLKEHWKEYSFNADEWKEEEHYWNYNYQNYSRKDNENE